MPDRRRKRIIRTDDYRNKHIIEVFAVTELIPTMMHAQEALIFKAINVLTQRDRTFAMYFDNVVVMMEQICKQTGVEDTNEEDRNILSDYVTYVTKKLDLGEIPVKLAEWLEAGHTDPKTASPDAPQGTNEPG